jgi:hypothetical protein
MVHHGRIYVQVAKNLQGVTQAARQAQMREK